MISEIHKQNVMSQLAYDPLSGRIFRQRDSHKGRWKAGKTSGHVSKINGYRYIVVERKQHLAHRLAWLLHYGWMPEDGIDIDHINGDRDDNRIENLRLGSRSQNNVNSKTPKNNTSGFKGAYFDKRRGKWAAEIWVFKSKKFLGYYSTPKEAGAAYQTAAQRFYGEFARMVG